MSSRTPSFIAVCPILYRDYRAIDHCLCFDSWDDEMAYFFLERLKVKASKDKRAMMD